MRILGIIPARGGSKGVPGKNIKLLKGKPLVQYTLASAQASKMLSKVIISSDDPGIIAVAESIGLEAPFVRPAHLAADDTSSLEVVIHALKFFEDRGEKFDAVCLLQVTTPFREENLIDNAIEKFLKQGSDSLVTVRKVPPEFNPHWIFEEKGDYLHISTGDKNIISRRQDLPEAYYRDGGIYLTRSEIILKQHSLYGNSIGFILSENENYVNIDTFADWEKAEILAQKNLT